jgi:hypothetical protein
MFESEATVLVKRRLLLRGMGYADGFVLAFLEWPAFEKGDFLLEDRDVTRDLNVLSHCIRKPQEIIGATEIQRYLPIVPASCSRASKSEAFSSSDCLVVTDFALPNAGVSSKKTSPTAWERWFERPASRS